MVDAIITAVMTTDMVTRLRQFPFVRSSSADSFSGEWDRQVPGQNWDCQSSRGGCLRGCPPESPEGRIRWTPDGRLSPHGFGAVDGLPDVGMACVLSGLRDDVQDRPPSRPPSSRFEPGGLG